MDLKSVTLTLDFTNGKTLQTTMDAPKRKEGQTEEEYEQSLMIIAGTAGRLIAKRENDPVFGELFRGKE